jgi:signal transduction histidine kinase
LNKLNKQVSEIGNKSDLSKRIIISGKDELNESVKIINETLQVIETLNKTLEQKVLERTKKIDNLLKQKDEFINQLGHDLKNPLNPLVNLLPILEKSEPDLKNKEIYNVLIRNANYMKNLVIKTIDLGRLNSPNTKFYFEDVDLSAEFNDNINNNITFKEKNIEIKNNIPDNITVQADKLRINELIINLLNNAAKYTNYQGIIKLDAKQENNSVTVSVKDSGIGMTNEQLDHVFDEFYKADSSRHDFDSSGLGLSICKRIVEIHNGKIWVESEGLGKGSTFYFTIPKNKMRNVNRSMECIYNRIDKIHLKSENKIGGNIE